MYYDVLRVIQRHNTAVYAQWAECAQVCSGVQKCAEVCRSVQRCVRITALLLPYYDLRALFAPPPRAEARGDGDDLDLARADGAALEVEASA